MKKMPVPASQKGFANKIIRDLRKGKRRSSDVRVWQNRIRRGLKFLEPAYEDGLRNRQFYIGEQLTRESCASDAEYRHVMKMAEGGDTIMVNRILASLAAQNSALLWKHPWHKLSTRRLLTNPNDAEASRVMAEYCLNYVLRAPGNNWLTKARLAVLCAQLDMGILKAVYAPHEGDDPTPEEKRYGEIVMGTIMQEDGTAKDVQHYLGGQPKLGKDGNPMLASGNRYVVETRDPSEYYRTEWVPFDSMVFDPEGGNNLDETHGWCAQRGVMRWSKFKENMLFQDAVKDVKEVARYIDDEDLPANTKRAIESGYLEGDGETSGNRGAGGWGESPVDEDVMRVWYWQCWDFETREVSYLVDGYEKLAQKIEYPDYLDRQVSPYSIMKVHENPGTVTPITEVSQVRGLSRAYNFVQTLSYRHIQRYSRWYLYREGMFDQRAQSRIMDKRDGRIVPYKDGYSPAEFVPVKDAPLGSDHYAFGQRLLMDHDLLMGSSGEQKGSPESETATQALLVNEGISGRQNDKRGAFREAFEHHASIILSMMQNTPEMDTSMLVQIVGPEGVKYQGKHGRAQIQGHFISEIDLEELEPADSQVERREFREVLQVLGPIAFASPTFSQRFWRSHRSFSENMVREFTELGQQILQQQAEAASKDGGEKVDGGGPAGPGQTQARSNGHMARAGG